MLVVSSVPPVIATAGVVAAKRAQIPIAVATAARSNPRDR
jgi:hypothetical protein